jgi:MoaA/NifB/PqqE/SkfB family radical SAM enzyme
MKRPDIFNKQLLSLKEWFWKKQESPVIFIRTLQWATIILQLKSYWDSSRLLHRLGTIERLAKHKSEEWCENELVEAARLDYLRAFRELAGPGLKAVEPPDERRRLNRILSKAESRLGVHNPYCRPFRMRIELTDACNLRCYMCPQSKGGWKPSNATDWMIGRAESLYPWVSEVDYTSFGETLLSKNFERVLHNSPPHARRVLITNGLLIDDAMAHLLIESGLSDLTISIDASTAETYQSIRGVDTFERVLENCRRMVRKKIELHSSTPRLYFNFTLSCRNMHDLSGLIHLTSEIGFQGVHLNYLMVWDEKLREDSVYWIQEETCRIIDEARQLAGELGIEFEHPPKPDEPVKGNPKGARSCTEPWEFMNFPAKGSITICCLGAEEIIASEGTGWEEVWDSLPYQNFRKRVNLPGDLAPPLCRNCTFGNKIPTSDPRYHFICEHFEEHIADKPKVLNNEPGKPHPSIPSP